MPEISIYKSPWKAIRLILLSTPFVIFSLVELSSTISISYAWMNWFSLCFFGLGVLMGLFNLLDRRPEMMLNEEGIFDRMTYGIFDKRDNRSVIKWNSIKDVSLHIQQLKSSHGIPLSKKNTFA